LYSTRSGEEATTLASYVERIKDGHEQIFYATGESRLQLLKSPHLEPFKAKGYEVLLFTDPVDEVWLGSVVSQDFWARRDYLGRHKIRADRDHRALTVHVGTDGNRSYLADAATG
jgi:HSP90 family molecular chaperone